MSTPSHIDILLAVADAFGVTADGIPTGRTERERSARHAAIHLCRSYGMTVEFIARWLGVSKDSVVDARKRAQNRLTADHDRQFLKTYRTAADVLQPQPVTA